MQSGGIPEGAIDLGLPSGTLWAKANIDVTTDSGFQEKNGKISPYKYDCSFFSWGNTDWHNPTSTSAFDYNWGSSNSGDPYASSPGRQLTGDIPLSHDAARVNLGAPWRMPTTAEYDELFANVYFLNASGNVIDDEALTKTCKYNGVVGLRLRSMINGEEIFFASSGYGGSKSWGYRGNRGYYWSASYSSKTYGLRLFFANDGGVNPQGNGYRFYGHPVRPVVG